MAVRTRRVYEHLLVGGGGQEGRWGKGASYCVLVVKVESLLGMCELVGPKNTGTRFVRVSGWDGVGIRM